MREFEITKNDAERRLDRFLRKFLPNASLGAIYKIIRKDVKVNGRRQNESYVLKPGDTLALYINDEELKRLSGVTNLEALNGNGEGEYGTSHAVARNKNSGKPKRTFDIVYEDENILIAGKPFGLLTHGDSSEKRNHLANQVKDYLIANGEYNPREERVFSPAPANRLDRNTTGLVLFGKTAEALKALNEMIREDMIDKYYMTIVHGAVESELHLEGELRKDSSQNKAAIFELGSGRGKEIRTTVYPVRFIGRGLSGAVATEVEVLLETGRTHQIRAHLAAAGHPVIGDTKYAGNNKFVRKKNEDLRRIAGLPAQLLHSHRVVFKSCLPELSYLEGKSFSAEPQWDIELIEQALNAK